MKINRLKLINYRCFKELKIDLQDRFTLLVGNNGSGKSAVLDGLAVGLASFFLGMDGAPSGSIHASDVRTECFMLGSRLERQAQYPSRIECEGVVNGQALVWARTLNTEDGKTTYGDANTLSRLSRSLAQKVRQGDPSVRLPILSYYGTGRLWAKKREKKKAAKVNLNSRFAGYADCLDAMSNEKLLYKWLEQMTYQELQEQKPVPELEAVKRAIVSCFAHSGNPEFKGDTAFCNYNIKTHEVEIVYHTLDGRTEAHPLNEMSDGYRNMLSMVADIAYRMALLNPQLLDKVTTETEGVVLIDEIDLHLHPAWQRHIVEALKNIFPKVQFIATTHAPSVIASVQQHEVVVLRDCSAVSAPALTYGKDANAILRTVMNVPERQDSVEIEIAAFHTALGNGEIEQARRCLRSIANVLGEDDPEVVGAETALALETME